ncbi:unnamed protein product [Effrenium voratum]|uniref:Uncharacterized protein n=1 Tax=Effrenium voratum TaxID=2562239 RepID=A0AA36IMQ4_9DINO|nr:unnamed protein product [Effrenium voratum]
MSEISVDRTIEMPPPSESRDALLADARREVMLHVQGQLRDSAGNVKHADINSWLAEVVAEPRTQNCLQELESAVQARYCPPKLLTSIPAPPAKEETIAFSLSWRKLGVREDRFCRFAPAVPQVIDCSTFLLDRDGCNSGESPITVYFDEAAGTEMQDGTVCIDAGSGCVTACHTILTVAALQEWHQKPGFATIAPYLYKCMYLHCRYMFAKDLTKRRRLST